VKPATAKQAVADGEQAFVEPLQTQQVSNDAIYARIDSLVDRPALAASRVIVLGQGRAGQPITEQLARHGVGTDPEGSILCCDGDDVGPHNLVGTHYGMRHIGMPKSDASVSLIREFNPLVNARSYPKKITTNDIPDLVRLAPGVDLMVLAMDAFRLVPEIARQCHGHCVMLGVFFGERCDYAEIVFSIPGVTQSIAETLGQRQRQAIAGAAALGTSTEFVTCYAAEIALRLLLGDRKGSELVQCFSNAPLIICGLRPTWIFANQSPDIARSAAHVGVNPVSR
jgi:molybdopterin/thiamine biosynthesis adenylyltransferase